jgi:hypothetical protein
VISGSTAARVRFGREPRAAVSGERRTEMIDDDPRLQQGAYITDGVDLYEVLGMERGPGVMGVSTVRVLVENCLSLRGLEFLPEKVRKTFNLVKNAPAGSCPDLLDDIAW